MNADDISLGVVVPRTVPRGHGLKNAETEG